MPRVPVATLRIRPDTALVRRRADVRRAAPPAVIAADGQALRTAIRAYAAAHATAKQAAPAPPGSGSGW